jgi:hypothetical protein
MNLASCERPLIFRLWKSRRLHRSKVSSVKAVELRKAEGPKVECEIVSRAIGYLQPVADHCYKTTLIS